MLCGSLDLHPAHAHAHAANASTTAPAERGEIRFGSLVRRLEQQRLFARDEGRGRDD
jgi:hypothetical protein